MIPIVAHLKRTFNEIWRRKGFGKRLKKLTKRFWGYHGDSWRAACPEEYLPAIAMMAAPSGCGKEEAEPEETAQTVFRAGHFGYSLKEKGFSGKMKQ